MTDTQATNTAYMLGRVEEAIDRLTDTLRDFKQTQDDHGKRLVHLERWLMGALASVGAFVAWLGWERFN